MAARQIPESQPADSNSNQLFHFVPNFVKHPSNLAINSLPQDSPQSCRFDQMHGIYSGALAVEHNALMQFRRERRIPGAIERHLIFFFDFVSGMGETLGQVAIVGKQKEAFRLGVEPPDIEETRQMRRQEIEDGIAGVRIASCRNETGRLMQHDVQTALAVDQFATHFDVVAFRGLRAEVGADPAVDGHAPFRDQLIAMPSGAEPGRGEITVQAHEIESEW